MIPSNILKIAVALSNELYLKNFDTILNSNASIALTLKTTQSYVLLKHLQQHIDTNVVFLEYDLDKIDGVQLSSLIRHFYPHIKIIILCKQTQIEVLLSCIKSGALGIKPLYILEEEFIKNNPQIKQDISNTLLDVIKNQYHFSKRIFNNGNEVNSNFLSEYLIANKSLQTIHYAIKTYNLTHKEVDVCLLYATTINNKEIAEFLNISTRTIETHIQNVSKKLQCNGFKELVLKLIKINIVQVGLNSF